MSTNNDQLKKLFSDLYYLEKQAYDLYQQYIDQLDNPIIIKVVKQIQTEEANHMEIAKKLQALAEHG